MAYRQCNMLNEKGGRVGLDSCLEQTALLPFWIKTTLFLGGGCQLTLLVVEWQVLWFLHALGVPQRAFITDGTITLYTFAS